MRNRKLLGTLLFATLALTAFCVGMFGSSASQGATSPQSEQSGAGIGGKLLPWTKKLAPNRGSDDESQKNAETEKDAANDEPEIDLEEEARKAEERRKREEERAERLKAEREVRTEKRDEELAIQAEQERQRQEAAKAAAGLDTPGTLNSTGGSKGENAPLRDPKNPLANPDYIFEFVLHDLFGNHASQLQPIDENLLLTKLPDWWPPVEYGDEGVARTFLGCKTVEDCDKVASAYIFYAAYDLNGGHKFQRAEVIEVLQSPGGRQCRAKIIGGIQEFQERFQKTYKRAARIGMFCCWGSVAIVVAIIVLLIVVFTKKPRGPRPR